MQIQQTRVRVLDHYLKSIRRGAKFRVVFSIPAGQLSETLNRAGFRPMQHRVTRFFLRAEDRFQYLIARVVMLFGKTFLKRAGTSEQSFGVGANGLAEIDMRNEKTTKIYIATAIRGSMFPRQQPS